MRCKLLLSVVLVCLALTHVGWCADRKRKEKEEQDADIMDRFALMGVRRVAVIPFVTLERPMPVTGFYSQKQQEEEKKRWEEDKAMAAEIAKSVSELLPKMLTDWKRFEVATPQAVNEAMDALKLKPSDLVQSKPGAKITVTNGEGVRALRQALKVDALLVGGADVKWVQYDAEVNLRFQLIGNDPALPIVSTAVPGRSSRRMKAAAQAALLMAMSLFPSRDTRALDEVEKIAVMVLPPVEVLTDAKSGGASMVIEAKLDELLSQQMRALNHEILPPQDLAAALLRMKLSPVELVSRASKDATSVPQVDVAKFQAIAERAQVDAIFVAQILDVETTLSGTGMGLPSLIPYVGTILRTPLFRHRSTYTVMRAQIIARGKPYPIWTYITQGMPPRKILQNPRNLPDLERFFSDLSAQIVLDISGQGFALPGAGRGE
jgi:hypothetical protein